MARDGKRDGRGADANPGVFSKTQVLIQNARGGDARAMDALFNGFRDPLERYLHAQLPAMVRSVQDTQDAVQEVLLRAYKSLGHYQYRGVGSFWGYLRTIARNYVTETAREKRRWGGARGADGGGANAQLRDRAPSPADALAGRERFERYEKALDRLVERTRNAFLMRFELHMDYQRIAQECRFASGDAARMAVARALAQVAESLSRGPRDS